MGNEIYPVSWWGSPVENGWGGIYYDYAVTSAIPSLLASLQARAPYYENITCTTATLTELEIIE
tara:strand:+ start:127 stop:318 length:192 start_codon:yes stop_codon:yes gene_type:complete